ncbi:hypothetical protein C7C56_010780, partial [Massilia glaciei]
MGVANLILPLDHHNDHVALDAYTGAHAGALDHATVGYALADQMLAATVAQAPAKLGAEPKLFDVAALARSQGAMDGQMVVAANDVLKGSGKLDLSTLNSGIVQIELGGTAPLVQAGENIFELVPDATSLKLFAHTEVPLDESMAGTSGGAAADITVTGSEVQLDGAASSAGAVLSFVPLDTASTIVFGASGGDVAGAMNINIVDVAQLQDGFDQIVIGSDLGHHTINIGSAGSSAPIQLSDTLVLRNPLLGGEIFVNSPLTLTDNASLIVYGSGHTMAYADSVSAEGDILIHDSVEINSSTKAVIITAGSDGSGQMSFGDDSGMYFRGVPGGVLDSVTLRGPDNIVFSGDIGNTTAANGAMANLTIEGVNVNGTINTPDDITFKGSVTLAGNLIINASGAVVFNSNINLGGGNLTILGATSVTFGGSVNVGGGSIFIEADEITFAGGGESVSGSGAMTLRPATIGLKVDVGDPAGSSTLDTLNIDNADITRFADGFSKIVIGHQGLDGHAAAGAGAVRIGAASGLQAPTLRDNLEVYGGSITVVDY